MLRALAASLSSGAAYALFGACIVLVYRTTGTLHFAITAVGALGAFTMLSLVDSGTSSVAAALVSVALGAAIGAAMGGVFATWFRDRRKLTKSTVTIALLLGLLATGFRVFGDNPRAARPFLRGSFEEFAGVRISHDTVIAVCLAAAVPVAASLVLYRTGIGVRLRAMAENPVDAELTGVPVGSLTVAVWGLTGGLAVLAAVLVGPSRPAAFAPLVFLLLPGLAAGLAGGFVRLWTTLPAGLVIAFGETYAARFSVISKYRATIPFFFILALLLWQRRAEVWDEPR